MIAIKKFKKLSSIITDIFNFYILDNQSSQSIKNVLENRNELTQVSEYITSLAKCTAGLYSRSHV